MAIWNSRGNLIRALAAVAVRDAEFEFHPVDLDEDSEHWNTEAYWWGTRDGFRGCWSTGPTVEASRADLQSCIQDWCLIKLTDFDDDIPTIEGIDVYDLSMSASPLIVSWTGAVSS